MPNDSIIPDPLAQAPQEMGYDFPAAQQKEGRVPGDGAMPLPHFMTFSQVVNWASRTYRYTFDEALRHSAKNTLALRRDPVVMEAIRSRQMATAQLPWHLEPANPEDTAQVEAAKEITAILKATPRFEQMMMHLLEAIFYGRYGVQMNYSWDFSAGKRRMIVKDFKPVNGDKMCFRYSGQAGILVHATYQGNWSITDRGRAHFFSPEEREQILIHKHEPEDADFYEGELAGGIHGVGIRSKIYWLWYLRSQVLTFLMDYLERIGAGGLTVYYFEAGNPQSLAEVKQCAEEQMRNNTILFPRYRDNSTGGPGIERIDPSPAGAQLLYDLITQYFDQQIRRYIQGADNNEMTEGEAAVLGDTHSRMVRYDAMNLQETLTHDLVKVLQKYNFPGLPQIKFVFDIDKPNAVETLQAAQAFYQMGGTLDEDELRAVLGLSRPQPGHAILAQNMPLNPSTMGTQPTGVPIEGQSGPVPQGGAEVSPNGVPTTEGAQGGGEMPPAPV